MGQRGLKQSQTGKRAGFEGCLIKGEKVHKVRIYDTEKKPPCFFPMACFTVPCARLILVITVRCSRHRLNPKHVKGIGTSSLGN